MTSIPAPLPCCNEAAQADNCGCRDRRSCCDEAAQADNCGCRDRRSCCNETAQADNCGCRDRRPCCNEAAQADNCGCRETRRSCCNEAAQADPCDCHHDRPSAAMVYAAHQSLTPMLSDEAALSEGTLFHDLVKPMETGCRMPTCPCASQQQQTAFVAWELRLYLNTHPDDQCAMELYRQKCRELDDPSYACAFTKSCPADHCWRWLDDPWPWEYQCCHNGRE